MFMLSLVSDTSTHTRTNFVTQCKCRDLDVKKLQYSYYSPTSLDSRVSVTLLLTCRDDYNITVQNGLLF